MPNKSKLRMLLLAALILAGIALGIPAVLIGIGYARAAAEVSAKFTPEYLQSLTARTSEIPPLLRSAVGLIEAPYGEAAPDPLGGVFGMLIEGIWTRKITIDDRHKIEFRVAKTFFSSQEKTLAYMWHRLFLSEALYRRVKPNALLEAFLDQGYLGLNGASEIRGVRAGAMYYFHKPCRELSVPESALLAGMFQSPAYNSPFSNPDHARKRRNYILSLLKESRLISEQEFDHGVKASLPPAPAAKGAVMPEGH